MKVAYVISGTGEAFYCENCIRDINLVQGLAAMGHDVRVVPLYLPVLRSGGYPVPVAPVFCGAVGMYLEHRWPWLRRLPRALRRGFNAPLLLRMASARSGSTRATGLEALTLSMLRGEAGGQAAELAEAVGWLRNVFQPDVVHLPNGLLLGLAAPLRRELGAPVICTLQDEDTWVDTMRPGYPEQVFGLMAAHAADVAAFVTVSRYYAQRIGPRLGLDADRIQVVHLGVDTTKFRPAETVPEHPTLGYLSRMNARGGLGMLVEAFARIGREPDLGTVRLRLTGGATGEDRRYLRGLLRTLAARGMADVVDVVEPFHEEARAAFLRSLSLLSVPMDSGEAFGLFLLESLACGVPALQPSVGGFQEVAALTGGVELYPPGNVEALADGLKRLLCDEGRRRALAEKGTEVVRHAYTLEGMARDVSEVYEMAKGS